LSLQRWTVRTQGWRLFLPTCWTTRCALGLERLASLGADQVEAVARLARSGAGVECVEAGPGSGKTTALGVYVAACRRAGLAVIGCAPSARARDELRLGARIEPCYTVDGLLLALRRSALAPRSVVILDEASMAGSRKLGRLLGLAAAAGAKVVLVGDTKQLSSVDAGGGFRGLVARLGAHRLVENRRQVEGWEREALRNLREGQVRPALTAYAARGRLQMGDREELVERMVDDWWTARADGEAVMQASTWRDVLELNDRARGKLVKAGEVEREGLDIRGVTIGVGDQVIVLRNDRTVGVINGTLGTVTAVDRQRGDLVLRTVEPDPRDVRLPASYWNAKGRRRVSLAYCRGTRANTLYYAGDPPLDEDHHAAEAPAPEFEQLVAAAGRSRSQVMALDLLADAAPMTEAQVATLARCGVVSERNLTWVQASLLIDDANGRERGERAANWLRANGAQPSEAARIVATASHDMRTCAPLRAANAMDVRLAVLEAAAGSGRQLSQAAAGELAALQGSGAVARARRRESRERWARQAPAEPTPASRNGVLIDIGSGRPPPRARR